MRGSLLLGLLGAACTGDRATEPPSLWSERDEVSRIGIPTAYEPLWRIDGEADTTLLDPVFLAAGREGVTVWDRGRKSVVRITPEGNVAWRFGREGEGPGEFRLVRDVVHLGNGGAVVADNRNARITILSVTGQLMNEASVTVGSVQSAAALPGGGVVVAANAPDPFALFDETGEYLGSAGFPWDGYGEMSRMATQGKVVGTGKGWVYGFTIGNGWWRIDEDGEAQGFPYAEHTDFPTVTTEAGGGIVRTRLAKGYVPSAIGLSALADTLLVHYGGKGELRWRQVDLFNLGDGTYLGSLTLPEAALGTAFAGNILYTLSFTPYPLLSAFRRRDPTTP